MFQCPRNLLCSPKCLLRFAPQVFLPCPCEVTSLVSHVSRWVGIMAIIQQDAVEWSWETLALETHSIIAPKHSDAQASHCRCGVHKLLFNKWREHIFLYFISVNCRYTLTAAMAFSWGKCVKGISPGLGCLLKVGEAIFVVYAWWVWGEGRLRWSPISQWWRRHGRTQVQCPQ